jgi:TM2 domain-containing membrane protein YozV/RNA polymerase subunit RPABC4/transcription elongation factor Spt4
LSEENVKTSASNLGFHYPKGLTIPAKSYLILRKELFLRRYFVYCRSCGKELEGNPEICTYCGEKTLGGTAFCSHCGAPTTPLTGICPVCGVLVTRGAVVTSTKSRTVLLLLAIFLGTLGIHRFYYGKTGTAVVLLILGAVGWFMLGYPKFPGFGMYFLIAVGIWLIYDIVQILRGKITDKEDRPITKW